MIMQLAVIAFANLQSVYIQKQNFTTYMLSSCNLIFFL